MDPALPSPVEHIIQGCVSVPIEVHAWLEQSGGGRKIQELRDAIRSEWEKQPQRGVLSGPVSVEVTYYLKTPRNLLSQVDEELVHYASGTYSPDINKLNQCVVAALTNISYGQTCQVVTLSATKLLCKTGENPRTDLCIQRLSQDMFPPQSPLRPHSEGALDERSRRSFIPLPAGRMRAGSAPVEIGIFPHVSGESAGTPLQKSETAPTSDLPSSVEQLDGD